MRLAASEKRSRSLAACHLPRRTKYRVDGSPLQGERSSWQCRKEVVDTAERWSQQETSLASLPASLRCYQAKRSKSCFIAQYNCSSWYGFMFDDFHLMEVRKH